MVVTNLRIYLFEDVTMFAIAMMMRPLANGGRFVLVILKDGFEVSGVGRVIGTFGAIKVVVELTFVVALGVGVNYSVDGFVFEVYQVIYALGDIIPSCFVDVNQCVEAMGVFSVDVTD